MARELFTSLLALGVAGSQMLIYPPQEPRAFLTLEIAQVCPAKYREDGQP